jgi:hypothetical protein
MINAHTYPFWNVQASFASCCTCEPLEMPADSYRYSTTRMEWRKAVNTYAMQQGLINVVFSPRDKVATALLPAPCKHREAQTVRLEVNYLREGKQ